MLWNKKEEKSALPDLPPIEPPFKQDLPDVKEAKEPSQTESNEPNALPSFPDSPTMKGFSQTVIKEAVADNNEKEMESIGNTPKEFKAVEMDEHLDEAHPSIIQTKPVPFREDSFYQANAQPQSIIPLPPSQSASQPAPKFVQSPPLIRPSLPLPQSSPKFEMEETFSLPQRFAHPLAHEKPSHVFVKIDKFFSAKKALDDTKKQLDQIEDLLKKIRDVKLREEQELASWDKDLLLAKSRIKEVTQNIFERIE